MEKKSNTLADILDTEGSFQKFELKSIRNELGSIKVYDTLISFINAMRQNH